MLQVQTISKRRRIILVADKTCFQWKHSWFFQWHCGCSCIRLTNVYSHAPFERNIRFYWWFFHWRFCFHRLHNSTHARAHTHKIITLMINNNQDIDHWTDKDCTFVQRKGDKRRSNRWKMSPVEILIYKTFWVNIHLCLELNVKLWEFVGLVWRSSPWTECVSLAVAHMSCTTTLSSLNKCTHYLVTRSVLEILCLDLKLTEWHIVWAAVAAWCQLSDVSFYKGSPEVLKKKKSKMHSSDSVFSQMLWLNNKYMLDPCRRRTDRNEWGECRKENTFKCINKVSIHRVDSCSETWRKVFKHVSNAGARLKNEREKNMAILLGV